MSTDPYEIDWAAQTGHLRDAAGQEADWYAAVAAGLLRRAGLGAVTSRSTLLERPVPLPADDVERVVAKLTHRVDWLRPAGLLAAADLAVWDRLLDPADPAYLGRCPDLHSVEARTVHTATRAAD